MASYVGLGGAVCALPPPQHAQHAPLTWPILPTTHHSAMVAVGGAQTQCIMLIQAFGVAPNFRMCGWEGCPPSALHGYTARGAQPSSASFSPPLGTCVAWGPCGGALWVWRCRGWHACTHAGGTPDCHPLPPTCSHCLHPLPHAPRVPWGLWVPALACHKAPTAVGHALCMAAAPASPMPTRFPPYLGPHWAELSDSKCVSHQTDPSGRACAALLAKLEALN